MRDWNEEEFCKGQCVESKGGGRPKMTGAEGIIRAVQPGKGCELIPSAIPLNAGVTFSICF